MRLFYPKSVFRGVKLFLGLGNLFIISKIENKFVTGSFLDDNGLFYQEEVSQEDGSRILLFEDVNYKVKSTSKL